MLVDGAIGGQFQAHEDRPVNWDAWDVDIFVTDKTFLAEPAESVRVVEEGPLRATLEIKRRILNSPYTQRISLSHNSPRLDFANDIIWNERHIMLKVAFPVDVFSPTATYEIQWGNTERPTHRNSSWDWARFETCAQKWVDLSEGGYGVSVLNDCKYGHDIKDNVIRISLLRSPSLPDPLADAGAAPLCLQPAAARRPLERGNDRAGLCAQRPADRALPGGRVQPAAGHRRRRHARCAGTLSAVAGQL